MTKTFHTALPNRCAISTYKHIKSEKFKVRRFGVKFSKQNKHCPRTKAVEASQLIKYTAETDV